MSIRKCLFVVGILVIASLGCSMVDRFGAPAATPTTVATATAVPSATGAAPTLAPTAALPPLTQALLDNFTYTIEYSQGTPLSLPLKNGEYTNPSTVPGEKMYAKRVPLAGFGDLNGDGAADAATAVGLNGGGSGTFVFIVAIINTPTGPVQAGTAFLDDRPLVNSITVSDGTVSVDFVGHGEKDPFCCPTLHLLRVYQLQNGQLNQIDEKPLP